ncbi:MAG: anti-sigma factor family protein [Bryobacteraceae bacterium]
MPGDGCRFTSEGELEEYWFGRLSASRKAAVQAHLARCESCQSLWSAVQGEIAWLRATLARWEAAHGDRRHASRHPVEGEAILALGSGRAQTRILAVQLRDECLGGLGVWSSERCRAGQRVIVERGGTPLRGIIRYCRRAGDRYQIGIQFVAA